MIERLIEASIRNRWLVIAAGLLLALSGLYAVYRTPVDAIPDQSENQVIVFTEWPGHSPPEIEGQLTYPLSLHLQGLAGVRVVRSSSDFNYSTISIIFEDGVDPATARDRVSQRLASSRGALPPTVIPALAPDAAATGQIFWYTVEGAGHDLAQLRAVQDWYVRPQLSSVPGVVEVASVGGYAGEYAIEVDPRRLQALGVKLADVLQAVSRANAAVGGDVIHKANAEYIVRSLARARPETKWELPSRVAELFLYLIVEELSIRAAVLESEVSDYIQKRRRVRLELPTVTAMVHHHDGAPHANDRRQPTGGAEQPTGAGHSPGMHMQHIMRTPTIPPLTPPPALDRLQQDLIQRIKKQIVLWSAERVELAGFGGELDRAMQMPGWTNVWTMPIQNRVDMLSTGVNTTVGVRVLGRRLDDVIRASEDVAVIVAKVPGAVNVIADRLRGKGYLQIHPDRERAAHLGVRVEDINELVEVALGGKIATQTLEGRERHAVRVRYCPEWRADEESARALPAPVFGSPGRYVRLADVANVRISEGPATIKSENGLLRNYVRLNVRGRDSGEFVEEARRAVAARVQLPPGVFLEWTGQFEHEQRAGNTLMLILPIVILLIFLVLWLTYHDLADAVLMMLAVPGALAGGVFAQWLFGYKFSVTVWVGYIACFGMATATGIIMLVYLREAIARGGGLEKLTREQLRQAVMDGAVHRLRPKLLTEGTMMLGLAPLLWSSGVGAEVIKPMVVPVLGGILIADEVIDLFLPVLFYWERRRRWQRLHQPAAPARASLAGAAGW